jgi:hypothetical protein
MDATASPLLPRHAAVTVPRAPPSRSWRQGERELVSGAGGWHTMPGMTGDSSYGLGQSTASICCYIWVACYRHLAQMLAQRPPLLTARGAVCGASVSGRRGARLQRHPRHPPRRAWSIRGTDETTPSAPVSQAAASAATAWARARDVDRRSTDPQRSPRHVRVAGGWRGGASRRTAGHTTLWRPSRRDGHVDAAHTAVTRHPMHPAWAQPTPPGMVEASRLEPYRGVVASGGSGRVPHGRYHLRIQWTLPNRLRVCECSAQGPRHPPFRSTDRGRCGVVPHAHASIVHDRASHDNL